MNHGPSAPPAKWYHGVVAVLILLFFVLGPFGLPVLWKSPRFSKGAKQTLTALTLLYTALLFWLTGSAVRESLQLLSQSNF